MNLNPYEGIAVFTDGSCYHVDRIGGWGWVALDAYEGLHTDSGAVRDTTISVMELTAAIMALNSIADEFGPCEVLVYSDSEYVVLGCQDRSRKRNANAMTWKKLDKAIARHDYVEFQHVKGHADNLFNEMADDLAGDARRKEREQ